MAFSSKIKSPVDHRCFTLRVSGDNEQDYRDLISMSGDSDENVKCSSDGETRR